MGMEEVIEASLIDEGLAERNTTTGELEGTAPDEGATPSSARADEGEAEGEESPAKAAATTEEEDDLDKELATLGVQRKDGKGQEARFRYSRFKKIWGNKEKALRESLTTENQKALKERDDRIAAWQKRIQTQDGVEKLIKENPARYLELLSVADPRFKELVRGGASPTQAAAQVAKEEGWKVPDPDAQYPDGSQGYRVETFQKTLQGLAEHVTNTTRKSVLDEMEKRYGTPLQTLVQDRREGEARRTHEQNVQTSVSEARSIYGKVFDDDFGALGKVKADSAVMRVITEHNQRGMPIPFKDACAIALIPKMKAERDTMREELMAELKAAPAAAQRSPGSQESTGKKGGGDRSLDEVIMDEYRRQGLI